MPDAICTKKKPPGCLSVAVTALEEQPHQYFVADDLPERSERKVRRKNKEYDENCRDELIERPARYSGNCPTTISSISVRTTKSERNRNDL